MKIQQESKSAAIVIVTHADDPVSCCFDKGMRDFVEDAGLLQENWTSLSLKRKRASADLLALSTS